VICQYCQRETKPLYPYHEGPGSCGTALVEDLESIRANDILNLGLVEPEVIKILGNLTNQIVELRQENIGLKMLIKTKKDKE